MARYGTLDNATRVRMARTLFQEQHKSPRTGHDVLVFYGWLEQNRPDLVPRPKSGSGPYQALKSDLSGLWSD